MRKHRKHTRRASWKVWLTAAAVVAALFVIGDESPDLRHRLEGLLHHILTGGPPPNQLKGRAVVIDGDTIDLDGTRIRLFGIDAPEGGQSCRRERQEWRCGQGATTALSTMIGQRAVRCEERDIDRYGRTVAECWTDGVNLNSLMVRQGWALAYRQYGGDIYDAEELIARTAGRGVWSGEFVAPRDWRRGQR